MWYYWTVKKESELGRKSSWFTGGMIAGIALTAAAVVCRANGASSYTPILHPTIFWHDNQWETYENGQWVPYHDPANNSFAAEPEPEMMPPEEPQGPENVDTNGFVPAYGWGFIGGPAFFRPHHHAVVHRRLEHRRPGRVAGRRADGLGRTTIGMGRPNVGIGQTTIGIGQNNTGIGQTTIGIGQKNSGIGRPNAGIGHRNVGMGQTTIGVGQPNVGIGQNNSGVGQTTIGVGQNNAGIGQPNTGIGQPTIGIGQQMGTQRGGWGR